MSINYILHYNESSLYTNLNDIFNLQSKEIPNTICRKDYTERLSNVSRLKIKDSSFYERYVVVKNSII